MEHSVPFCANQDSALKILNNTSVQNETKNL